MKSNGEMIPPVVSIIIPSYNNITFIHQCLQSLVTRTPIPHEIIVGADKCEPWFEEYLKNSPVKLKYVALKEHKGFAGACNAGAKIAKGKYLCFLNDDTLPAAGWLEGLVEAMENFQKATKFNLKVGAVGPMSNYASGDQGLTSKLYPGPQTPDTKDQVAAHLRERATMTYTGFLSGFCMLTPRDLFNEIGGWYEHFEGGSGAEDNQYCFELTKRGYTVVIARHSYVYHYGSQTLDQPEFKHLKRGVANVSKYMLRNQDLSPKTLGIMYRVKILNEMSWKWFEESLAKSATLADHIVVLDDGSPLAPNLQFKIFGVIKQAVGDKCKLHYVRHAREHEERRDRSEVLKTATGVGCDWVIALDADEVLEDKVTRASLDRLMHPIEPCVFAYAFHHYNFWDTGSVRSDGAFSTMFGPRMYRIQPGRTLAGGQKNTLHCEHLPVLPSSATHISSIRIKHYGYISAAERRRKYEYYTELDREVDPTLVGNTSYKHMLEEHVKLAPWREKSSIGVFTMFKDNKIEAVTFLRHISSFVDQIVAVDTGSTDPEMRKLFEAAGAEIIDCPLENDYSAPRNKALERMTTDWILQLDLDESIPDLTAVRRMVDYDDADGFIFSIRNFTSSGYTYVSETIRMWKRVLNFKFEGLVHETVDNSAKRSNAKIVRAKIVMLHTGYQVPSAQLKTKMMRYLKLNIKEALANPANAKPYYSIALHLLEEPEFVEWGMFLMKQARILAPEWPLPKKELAVAHMKLAYSFIKEGLTCKSIGQLDATRMNQWGETLKPLIDIPPAVPTHARDYFAPLGGVRAIERLCDRLAEALGKEAEERRRETAASSKGSDRPGKAGELPVGKATERDKGASGVSERVASLH